MEYNYFMCKGKSYCAGVLLRAVNIAFLELVVNLLTIICI